MRKLSQPYHLLLVVGLLTAFLSLFCKAETIDIHIHDTYYILGARFMLLAPSVLLLLLCVLYTMASGILLSNKLTRLHIIITIIMAAPIITIPLWTVFYRHSFVGYDTFSHSQIQDIVAISFLLLIAGQFLFVANLVGGVISRLRRKK